MRGMWWSKQARGCAAQVADDTGYHFYPCDRKPKGKVIDPEDGIRAVCGIHLRMAKRFGYVVEAL